MISFSENNVFSLVFPSKINISDTILLSSKCFNYHGNLYPYGFALLGFRINNIRFFFIFIDCYIYLYMRSSYGAFSALSEPKLYKYNTFFFSSFLSRYNIIPHYIRRRNRWRSLYTIIIIIIIRCIKCI